MQQFTGELQLEELEDKIYRPGQDAPTVMTTKSEYRKEMEELFSNLDEVADEIHRSE